MDTFFKNAYEIKYTHNISFRIIYILKYVEDHCLNYIIKIY